MKGFKDFVNERIDGNIETPYDGIDESLVSFILESFNVRTQMHIYHLLTKSYAEHIAIGAFYDSISSTTDSIAEMSIGLGLSSNESSKKSFELDFSYDKATLLESVNSYRESVVYMLEETDSESILSINDALISIQSSIDTFLYKLQLK